MAANRRKFDEDFKAGAVRIVRETGKPIAQVARDLGINEGTLGHWCAQAAAAGRRRRCAELSPNAGVDPAAKGECGAGDAA